MHLIFTSNSIVFVGRPIGAQTYFYLRGRRP